MTKRRKLKRGYAAINRNFLNYPLARDARCKTDWHKSKKTGRWLCNLSGDNRIQFRLPEDYEEPRCPTPFDVNLLFVLLREARIQQTAGRLDFDSYSSLLRDLGFDGAVQTTTISKSGVSVHSRHTLMFGDLVPSQYYGSCR